MNVVLHIHSAVIYERKKTDKRGYQRYDRISFLSDNTAGISCIKINSKDVALAIRKKR